MSYVYELARNEGEYCLYYSEKNQDRFNEWTFSSGK